MQVVNYCKVIISIVFELSLPKKRLVLVFHLLMYSSLRVVKVFKDKKQLWLTMKGIFIWT